MATSEGVLALSCTNSQRSMAGYKAESETEMHDSTSSLTCLVPDIGDSTTEDGYSWSKPSG